MSRVGQHIDIFDRAALGQDTIYSNDSAFAGHTGMEIVGGRARLKTNGLNGYAQLLTPTFPVNQWGEVVIGLFNGTGTDGSVQIILRYAVGGTTQGYLAVAFPNGSTQVYDNVAGGPAVIDVTVSPVWVAGDVFRLEAIDNAIKVYKNDTIVGSATSAAPAIVGQPGMVINSTDKTNTEISRFSAGVYEVLSRWGRPAPFAPGSADRFR